MENLQYFLSIDNGTQSVRAMVFDSNGQLVAKSKIDIEPYFSDQPGWAEQHADYFWDALCKACQALWPTIANTQRIYCCSVSDYPTSHCSAYGQ